MRIVTTLAASMLLALATGCSGPLLVEQHTPAPGYSVRQAIAMQTLNPEAGGTDPVVGLDGRHVQESMTNYQNQPVPSEETKATGLESVFDIGSN